MDSEPRARAAAESYPTFWNHTPPAPPPHPVPAADAYSAFVRFTEDELPFAASPAADSGAE